MKNYIKLKFLILGFAPLLFINCKSNKGSNVSRGTGWQINSKDGGFQYNTNFKEQEAGPGLVFVEGGTFTKGRVQDDLLHDWNNTPNQQHVQSFYMDETEVTNIMYLEYLDWLKTVFPPTDDRFEHVYMSALPDTLVWRNRLGWNEGMTEYYLRHPGYGEYPVVGVSWIQANQFCQWRTDRVNEMLMSREGIMKKGAFRDSISADRLFSTDVYFAAPTKVYGGDESVFDTKYTQKAKEVDSTQKYIKRSDGLLLPAYRLPTETEWEYAAVALVGGREYNSYRGRKKYPWNGGYTRSGRKKIRGSQLANFKQGKGDYGGIAGWSDDGADITNAVKSYPPNDFGLYDMAGNVAEWVADVYRPIVDDEANDFNYYRGNVYVKNAIGKDGVPMVVQLDSIEYDTLSNGRIVPKVLPGQLAKMELEESDYYLRHNFDDSDNINYRDGDDNSLRDYDLYSEDDLEENKKRMYNAPKHRIEIDEDGNPERIYDKSNERTSLINDEVRVYKGGSWRDRAYWLDPAQRRFYPEDMATDFIGFRCAMDRVGSKSSKGKQKTKRHSRR